MEKAPDLAEERDKAAERGNLLMKGQEVKFSALEVSKALFPVPARGGEVGDHWPPALWPSPPGRAPISGTPLGSGVGAIIDQVYVQDLTGMSQLPGALCNLEFDASGAECGHRRRHRPTASGDPTFGVSKISPYELTTTSYVDRNISRLTPANYYAKVYAMAIRAMRRDTVKMIFNGDGQSTPDMYGIKNAKNMAGNPIFATVNVAEVVPDLLTDLMFAYGGDEELGGNCRLYLNKKDLQALGKLRGTNEKRRLFDIVPDAGNPNTGTIRDGGIIVPYSISSKLTALSPPPPVPPTSRPWCTATPPTTSLDCSGTIPSGGREREGRGAHAHHPGRRHGGRQSGCGQGPSWWLPCPRPEPDMSIPEEMKAQVLAYCREPEPDDADLMVLNQAWDSSKSYLEGLGYPSPRQRTTPGGVSG